MLNSFSNPVLKAPPKPSKNQSGQNAEDVWGNKAVYKGSMHKDPIRWSSDDNISEHNYRTSGKKGKKGDKTAMLERLK